MRTDSAMRAARFLMAGSILCLALRTSGARADQPRFVNAKVETRAAATNLEVRVEQIAAEEQQAQWIAYGVEAIAGDHSGCCGNDPGYGHGGICGTCNLEQERGNFSEQPSESKTVKLEGSPQLVVLLRVEMKRVMRIRLAFENCTLDAGGLRVVWLTGVKPEESVALLTKFVDAKGFDERKGHDLNEEALAAIALHVDSCVDRAFASFVGAGQPEGLREKASFWLGAARGKAGLALLEKMAKSDPSSHVREQVAFALSVSPEVEALEEMIRMAHDDTDAHVRGQALFWLGQKAGKKAESAITGVIQNDPDTEVKKKAVFALSQMPKEEGIPKLIEVAQTNKNPEVRKQAMFWLGQSGDPQALAFFEKILSQ
jgi:HEAT repeat protein